MYPSEQAGSVQGGVQVVNEQAVPCWSGSRGRGMGAAAGADRAGGGVPATAPHPVIRGAKLQGAVVTVGVDWYRGTGPGVYRVEVCGLLGQWFGPGVRGPGRHFYDSGICFPGGAQVWFNERGTGERDQFTVELPGSVVSAWAASERVAKLRALHGAGVWWCTRIDLAVDFRGVGLELVQAVEEACSRGELCGARTWRPVREFSRGRVTGETFYIGKRGKLGSGRLVRVYDKGLETGTAPRGEWVRLEVEFTGDCAKQVFAIVAAAGDQRAVFGEYLGDLWGSGVPVEGWRGAALRLVFGALDFREVTGSRLLVRRPRAAWWSEVLGLVEPERVRADRVRRQGLVRTARWLRQQVAPVLAGMVGRSGHSLGQVFENLVGELDEYERAVLRPVVWEYVQEYGEGSADRWEDNRAGRF